MKEKQKDQNASTSLKPFAKVENEKGKTNTQKEYQQEKHGHDSKATEENEGKNESENVTREAGNNKSQSKNSGANRKG